MRANAAYIYAYDYTIFLCLSADNIPLRAKEVSGEKKFTHR